MTSTWLNDLGDRNPQLLREIRGRFKGRNVLATIGVIGMIQILLLLVYTLQLPNNTSAYCIGIRPGGEILRTLADKGCAVNWARWWQDMFRSLIYLIPYIFYIPGLYGLVTDIGQESQKGTMNFLCLSPRSSQNILLGKFLGVPILSYFSLLLFMPLHLITAILGGVPLGLLVSFYLSLLAWGGVLFLAAMFVGFSTRSSQLGAVLANTQGLAIVALATIGVIPSLNIWNNYTIWRMFKFFNGNDYSTGRIDWFWWAINVDFGLSHLFLFANLAIVAYFLWRVLQRVFIQPTATLVGKGQSYTIVTYSTIVGLGFLCQSTWTASILERIALLASFFTIAGIPLIFALATPRQMILDWLRSKRDAALANRNQARSRPINNWLLGDKSPGITAIWINALIVYGLLSLAAFTASAPDFGRIIIGLFLSVTLIANYSLLVQLILLLANAKRQAWAIGSLIFAIIVPSILAVLPLFNTFMAYFTPWIWVLLTSRDYGGDNSPYTYELGLAIAALMVQVAILLAQVMIFRRRLHQLSRQ
jgi:hypothetical protein